MSDSVASYRRILKTSLITGGASFLNILIGLIRIKALAILLGPAGIGLVSLYTSFMAIATTIASMGVNTVGTRQIAEACGKENNDDLAIVRRAMFWGMLVLATTGGLVVWSLREMLAIHVLGGVEHSQIIAWLALGVAFSVASGSQGALIQGMRRIGDMAKLSVYGALLNTLLGVGLLFQWGSNALWAFILIGPLINFLLGHLYVSKLPKNKAGNQSTQEVIAQWKVFLQLGLPLMGAGLIQTATSLWIRVSVNNELGLEAVGHFQAAYSISMQYISFVLIAMGADYYPHLTSIINDKVAASRLVKEQTEIALLFSAPVFIAIVGLAPWLIHLLYSSGFSPAIEVLRWQIFGDILKVACWPMGFIILAAGAGKTFFLVEATTILLMGGLIACLLPSMGLQITGIAFLACYVYCLLLNCFLAWRLIHFKWSLSIVTLFLTTLLLCLAVVILSDYTEWGIHVTLILSFGFAFFTLINISKMTDSSGSINKLIAKVQASTSKYKQ